MHDRDAARRFVQMCAKRGDFDRDREEQEAVQTVESLLSDREEATRTHERRLAYIDRRIKELYGEEAGES